MPFTPGMHMRTGFSGLVSRAAAGVDKYRVSKRTQGHGTQGAANSNHHDRRVGRDDPHGSRSQTNVEPTRSVAERVRFNGTARTRNSIHSFGSTRPKAKEHATGEPSTTPLDSSSPSGRGRKFGDVLENLQSDPSRCQRLGDRKYRRSAFSFGTVFTTAHHTAAGKPDDPAYTTATLHCGRVYSKHRKFIVVECNEASFVALPIYTCNGAGLSKKSSREIPEYMDVMDRRVGIPGPANGVYGRLFCVADGESEDAPVLLRDDQIHHGRVGAKGNACVHLTEPFSFRYGVRSRIEAQLTDDSAHLLRQVRATKMAAGSFKVLQGLGPDHLLDLLGRMVQADFVEKLAQLRAESLVKMRAPNPLEAVNAELEEGEIA
ncbi:hypothetical protein PpBr36_08530 [Pyricularia pennisetigena]|uniref:hypothetical protein n=1 Tax=Pyricularia pennisetigena TaxID=1578925 RepID=UPI0011536283|nr:hypothetical protein PpBr36_08530 [Pyricularia pennisetigena]TLS24341.1 hypothetical protein PpBr36_08530 [Pyricularia pennisetigena]